MQSSLDAVYGLGRLAFGAALIASPATALQLREWSDIPPDKRVPGVLSALGAAGAGAALLARR
jgi:hypothetical protein